MSSFNLKLIKTSELLSRSECEEIVRKTVNRDDVKIKDVEIFGDENVFGFLGEYFRLIIHVIDDSENPISTQSKPLMYFVKSLPIVNQTKREMLESYGMFKKEWFMYSEVFSKFVKIDDSRRWHPICYLARPDLLVLDDLTVSGYTHLEYRSRFSPVLVKCCLRNIAKLHADGINYIDKVLQNENVEEKLKDYLIETSIIKDSVWFSVGLGAVKGCVPLAQNYYKYKDIWSHEEFDVRMSKTYEIVKPSKTFCNVLCHQDLWANNIMFNFEKKPNSNDLDYEKPINCVFMDYQFYKYAPPAIDVLQFLMMTTRLEHRRKYYEEYFQYYYDCLASELHALGFEAESVLSWKEFRLTCDELRIYPLIYNAVSTPIVFFSPEKLLNLKNTEPEKFDHMLLINRKDFMLKAMADDVLYKDVVMENIEELLDCMFGEVHK